MNIFGRLIPAWIWFAVIAALLAAICVQQLRIYSFKTDAAEHKAVDAEVARLAEKAVRALETRRQTNIDKEAENAAKQTATLETALPAAAAAGVSLHDTAKRTVSVARTRACPAAASPGKPGADSLDLLVDVLVRADNTAGKLAEYADRLRIAGTACERSYDSLSK